LIAYRLPELTIAIQMLCCIIVDIEMASNLKVVMTDAKSIIRIEEGFLNKAGKAYDRIFSLPEGYANATLT
jgi:hypothetical protein